jgi:signal transduction histidine kinase
MKQTTLEPGVLRVLQIATLLQVVGVFLIRLPIGYSMALEIPLGPFLALNLFVPLVLFVYVSVPWFQYHLGSAFLPLALVVSSANVLLDKYLRVGWLVQPGQQELELLLLTVHLWLVFQILTSLVAWQYSLRWVLVSALLLSCLDAALSLPFIRPGSQLYTLLLITLAARTFSVTLVALGVSWLMKRQREQQQALAAANQKLTQYAATTELLAVSQERNRLARDLHDTLAHSLSGVTVQLEAVQALWDVNADAARKMLDQATATTRSGLTEARRALHALRAKPLEDLGLALALSTLAESVAARTGLTLDLDVQHHLEQMAPDVEQCIYRVAQEALTNVARHAEATEVRVTLRVSPQRISLEIRDNGKGIPEHATRDATSLGLIGLRERAGALGGEVIFRGAPGQGTAVLVSLPNPGGIPSEGTP